MSTYATPRSIADLATPDGRAAMVDAVGAACDGVLDGLVAGAGVMGDELAVSVNFFGAVATLDGLRPLLRTATDPSAIAISSNSTTTTAGRARSTLVDACLAGDEATARGWPPPDPGTATRHRSSRSPAGYAATRSAPTGSGRAFG